MNRLVIFAVVLILVVLCAAFTIDATGTDPGAQHAASYSDEYGWSWDSGGD
jgi:hypothetical protein